jgi:two-component system sensor histidine kinase QseC
LSALENAEQGVFRLQRTVDQLLTLARLEGSFSFGEEESMAVSAVVQGAMQEIPAEGRERIRFDGGHSQARMKVPGILAMTAIRNLLDNALRYSPPGSPVHLYIDECGAFISFRVADEGPGMNEDDRHRAMQRFWRKGRGQGSGLGLSIVDAIARRYGGQFTLTPKAQSGMVAEVKFPAA